MKTFLALAALVSTVLGEAPLFQKAPADNPRGVYFVLPPAPQLKQHVSPDQVEEIMSQLRQEEGSDSGLYHIVLPDGRLQRVEYTTAPLKQESESEGPAAEANPSAPARILAHPAAPASQYARQEAAAPKPAGPSAILAQSPRPAQLNVAPAQPQRQEAAYPAIRLAKVDANGKLRLVSSFPAQEDTKGQYKQEETNAAPAPAKYVASVQYTEVQPIQGPIYSYNDQPLTRVVRYASLY
ncbi:hypothetical protein GE061_009549 [Apolygus lucorum]|uniref:Uncharacterized protein n=1 Tax=Apolygus lucorum TaxID=248454 RepID=A0A6A4KIE0_APOLU|nr:hypothetical protein GE061_009549 [Apolygus lucorum]